MAETSYICGLHTIQSVMERDRSSITRLWMDERRKDKRVERLAQGAAAAGIEVTWVPRRELDRLVPDQRHQGVVALVRQKGPLSETFLEDLLTRLEEPPFLLVLDGIQDPHNLGACLRSADAAGVHAVIAPRDRACGLTTTVRKVASGAAEAVPFIQVTNLARALKFLRQAGIRVVGTALEGADKDLFETPLKGALALVLGTEAKGLRRLTRENCDELVYIPMQGTVQSLNVSVATGICLFEAVRQRSRAR